MRLQPPINQEKFVGKEITTELIMEYIGSHKLLENDVEDTFEEYLLACPWIDETWKEKVLSLFPLEIVDLAEIYLDIFFKKHGRKCRFEKYQSQFCCSAPISFITSKGIKTMLPGKSYNENLEELD